VSGRRPARWSDHEVEQIVGRLLQVGVLVATLVVAVGAVALLLTQGSAVLDFSRFQGESSELRSVGSVIRGVSARDPRAIVQLGLILLIATPVARVALTLVAFALQRDRLYVALTTIVLAVLLYGLL
jgi:uncharacterized membrane protein